MPESRRCVYNARMKILGVEETRALLGYSELADALLAVLHDRKSGRAYAPTRQSVPLPGGASLLLMPAADGRLAVTKLVTVHPQNAGSQLPVVQADVLVFDAATGERLAILDGATVTARRTAALSLLAARLLAPEPGGPLLIVGSGVQARAHLEAFVQGLGVREIFITSRQSAHAEALAEHAASLGAAARAVDSPADVLGRATLVVTATTSHTPVVHDLPGNAFLAAVGAYVPEMAELAPGLVRRARIYVDTLEGCRAEAGDLIQAGIDWAQVTPLEEAIEQIRPEQGPVVFKSVGHALWDLASARLALGTMDRQL